MAITARYTPEAGRIQFQTKHVNQRRHNRLFTAV